MQMKYYRKAASPAARRTVHKVLSALLALAACFTVFAFTGYILGDMVNRYHRDNIFNRCLIIAWMNQGKTNMFGNLLD